MSADRLGIHLHHSAGATVMVDPPDERDHFPLLIIGDPGSDHWIYVGPEFGDQRESVTLDHVRFAGELLEAAKQYHAEIATAFTRDAALLVVEGDVA